MDFRLFNVETARTDKHRWTTQLNTVTQDVNAAETAIRELSKMQTSTDGLPLSYLSAHPILGALIRTIDSEAAQQAWSDEHHDHLRLAESIKHTLCVLLAALIIHHQDIQNSLNQLPLLLTLKRTRSPRWRKTWTAIFTQLQSSHWTALFALVQPQARPFDSKLQKIQNILADFLHSYLLGHHQGRQTYQSRENAPNHLSALEATDAVNSERLDLPPMREDRPIYLEFFHTINIADRLLQKPNNASQIKALKILLGVPPDVALDLKNVDQQAKVLQNARQSSDPRIRNNVVLIDWLSWMLPVVSEEHGASQHSATALHTTSAQSHQQFRQATQAFVKLARTSR